jgi:hypothetical protein
VAASGRAVIVDKPGRLPLPFFKVFNESQLVEEVARR